MMASAFRRAAVLLAVAPAAWACGVCIEDKVAATYDHAVVVRAAAKGKVMVFCEVAGLVDARQIRNAARAVRGIEPASLRISSQPAALSFALDDRQSPQAAVAAIQRAVPAGTRLAIVRLIAPSAPSAKAARSQASGE
jgi:hypothetical protein